MRRGRGTPWAAVGASAAVNLLLFIVLAWAQAPARSLPKPESWKVREIFQPALPPPEAVETPETPVVAESAPEVVEPAPIDAEPPAERFDARLDLPRVELPMPALPAPSFRGEAPVSAGPGPVDRAPRRVFAPLPDYPAWARLRRLEGVVTLRIVVAANGCVCQVDVDRVEGDPRFADAARETVRTWTFEPAVKSGRPVDCVLLQRVRFDLVDR